MLDAWEASYKAALSVDQMPLVAEADDHECLPDTKEVPEIALWVEALILVLEAMSQHQPKETSVPSSAPPVLAPSAGSPDSGMAGGVGNANQCPVSLQGDFCTIIDDVAKVVVGCGATAK